MVEDEDGGHEEVSLAGDAPTASALDYTNGPVHVEPFEQSGDAFGLAAGFEGIGGWKEELSADVPVGEAL